MEQKYLNDCKWLGMNGLKCQLMSVPIMYNVCDASGLPTLLLLVAQWLCNCESNTHPEFGLFWLISVYGKLFMNKNYLPILPCPSPLSLYSGHQHSLRKEWCSQTTCMIDIQTCGLWELGTASHHPISGLGFQWMMKVGMYISTPMGSTFACCPVVAVDCPTTGIGYPRFLTFPSFAKSVTKDNTAWVLLLSSKKLKLSLIVCKRMSIWWDEDWCITKIKGPNLHNFCLYWQS